MKMKTYQAASMQEALSKVKDEMGPDAVILKSRKSSWKVNGRSQPCFEVTAALEDASAPVAAGHAAPAAAGRPAPAAAGRAQPAFPAPMDPGDRRGDAPAGDRAAGADRRSPTRAGLPGVPERRAPAAAPASDTPADWSPQRPMAGRVPDERTYDWRGSLRRVDEEGRPAGRSPQGGQGPEAVQGSLLELLRNELREVKDKVDMPTREIQVLKKEIRAMVDSVAEVKKAQSRGQAAGLVDYGSPASLPEDLRPLHAWLTERDFDPDLAAELAFAARSAPLADAMAARIRTTGGVRLRQGKPAIIAMVGPTGAGKTTTLCKLAALARMHQGKQVAILSADSFRMGANEQLELFGRTAGIPVRPLFSAADAAPALREFASHDLILVDTAGRSHAHPENWAELQNLLRALSPDEIHLVLSCTTRMRELLHQAGLYGNLGRLAPACGVVFTKLDECVTLGCLYNLARRLDAPVSYLCDGQMIPDHISLATPQGVASKVLHAGRAAEEALRAAGQPVAVAG